MARLEIIKFGDPILRKHSLAILEITDEIKQLANDMVETMDLANGIGLAAPQVGKNIRLFVIREPIIEGEKFSLGSERVYINPKISNHSEETQVDIEGCLSVPGIQEEVIRPLKITIEAQDLDGRQFIEHVEGYKARVLMHENDHLNGTFFVDRLSEPVKLKIKPQLNQIKSESK